MQVHQIDGGDWVVDLGQKWFRIRDDGTVITRRTVKRKGSVFASITARMATEAEAKFAKSYIPPLEAENRKWV